MRLSRLFLYFGDLERHSYSLCKSRFACYDLLPLWKLALALSPHMDGLLILTVDLSPLFYQFSGIIKSALGDLSSPPSSPSSTSSSLILDLKMLQSLECSILDYLQRIRHHFDAVISLIRPLAVPMLGSTSTDHSISLVVSDCLDHAMSVFDDLHALIRATDTLFSTAQDVPNTVMYIHEMHSLVRN